MIDLDAELARAQSDITDADRAQLVAAGIAEQTIAAAGIGAARIDLDKSGTVYQPLEIGDAAFILPILADDPDTPESLAPDLAIDFGALVDLLAFHPADDDWATRRDAATWAGAIEPQFMTPKPVPIFRSPMTWLRGGRRGLCPLTRDPREVQSLLLRCRGGLEAEDAEHRRELRKLLSQPFRIPPVFVAGPKRGRDA